MIEIIQLESYSLKTPWAGNRMASFRTATAGSGIYREVCSYKDVSNNWLNSPKPKMTLQDGICQYHSEIMGNDPAFDMIRLAYMDTAEQLSIQVHPNEQMAKAMQDSEKTESWYIIDCADDAYIVAGTTIKQKSTFKDHILDETIDDHLVKIPVKKDDLILIPSGLVHACGGNMLALEIGSFGGITFRLFDYGRGRKLDIDLGLKALNPKLQAIKQNWSARRENVRYNALIHELFKIDILDLQTRFHVQKSDHYEILTNINGLINVAVNGNIYPLPPTKSLIIPACQNEYDIIGAGRLLISYR